MSINPREIPTGAVRYNTDTDRMEVYIGSTWMEVAVSSPSLDGGGRGLVAGGNFPDQSNSIQFVTISTLGKTQDFGDRTEAGSQVAHLSSTTRACFQGDSSPYNNVIDYVQIATTGDAFDFGDLSTAPNGNGYAAGASNGHGGLG